jgi:prolyl-tRNA synthetase
MACYIEQNHDANGIVWNKLLAPFQVHLLGLNLKKQQIVDASEKIYNDLIKEGIEVLFDDRDVTAGFKFNDADLLGMPIQVVIGEKKLKENKCEVKVRKSGERFDVELGELINKVKELLG